MQKKSPKTPNDLSTTPFPKIDNKENLKVFIGCLTKDIGLEELTSYFSKIVQFEHIELKSKKILGKDKSREHEVHFAVMTCTSPKSRDMVLSCKHKINQKNVKVTPYLENNELDKYVQNIKNCRIYIKKLPKEIEDEELKRIFSQFGVVLNAYSVQGSKVRRKWKYGYVVFEDEEDIDKIPEEGIEYGSTRLKWSSHRTKKRVEMSEGKIEQLIGREKKGKKKPGKKRKKKRNKEFDREEGEVESEPIITSSRNLQRFDLGTLRSSNSNRPLGFIPEARIASNEDHRSSGLVYKAEPTGQRAGTALNRRLILKKKERMMIIESGELAELCMPPTQIGHFRTYRREYGLSFNHRAQNIRLNNRQHNRERMI